MDLPESELLLVSQRYFYLGFAFLPLLWLVNFLYVFPVTRVKPGLNPKIRQCIVVLFHQ